MILSLVGIPGAGKTTMGRALERTRGWSHFELGRRLRERASQDTQLDALLSTGRLAPESVVHEIVSAAIAGRPDVLVLDGFPRHGAQLHLVATHRSWRLVHLELPIDVAQARLEVRRICATCHAPRGAQEERDGCPECGGPQTLLRGEDQPAWLVDRLAHAFDQVSELVSRVDRQLLVPIDANQPRTAVLAEIVHRLGAR